MPQKVSDVYGMVAPLELAEVVNSVPKATTYLLGLVIHEGFHLWVIATISDAKTDGMDSLSVFLIMVVKMLKSRRGASLGDFRVFFQVLHHSLVNAFSPTSYECA